MRYGGYDGFPFRVHPEGAPAFSWELHEDGPWRLWEYWGPGYKIGKVESCAEDGSVIAQCNLSNESTKCATENEGKEWLTTNFVALVMTTGINPRALTLEDLVTITKR